MILDDIVAKRKDQLEKEIKSVSREKIKELALSDSRTPLDFYHALNTTHLAVIAEVKKASPSKSVIREDFNPLQIAAEYENAGADAISCLTEEFYFQGNSNFLSDIRKNVKIPILRKDFIFDEYQIFEAKVIGADAILLIVSILPEEKIIEFSQLASSLGLQCLTEVHSLDEMQTAVNTNAKIIGINNRNLKTFDVSLKTTAKLAHLVPENTLIVSESGIASNNDMKTVKSYGSNAVLIGETLMKSNNIADTMKMLRNNT